MGCGQGTEKKSVLLYFIVGTAGRLVPSAAPKRKVSFGAEVSTAKAAARLQSDDEASEEEEGSIYSEEESGSSVASDEWWAQGGGRGDSCFGGDYGDDAAELERGEAERRENPALAEKRVEFFRGLVAGAAVEKRELLALSLSLDYTFECGLCDRDYKLRRGCPCCRD